MTRRRHVWAMVLALAAVALLWTASPQAATQDVSVPTPAEEIGFEPGAERQLADWEQIVGYFRTVDATSQRVELVELGRSPEGRLIVAAYISSQDNIARLPELLETQRLLTYMPEADDESSRWGGHKLFVLINCSIHSTEIGASQMAMGLLHRLATAEGQEAALIRERLVVILIPSPNPDGIEMVVQWYRRWLDTPYEGCQPPRLYERYAGHDNNRDWYALNLPETQVVNPWLSDVWFPPVTWDAHQMGRTGYRAFIPPFVDPPNPFIHPLVIEGIANAGHAMKSQALRDGFRGVADSSYFSLWWNGGFRTTANFKNSIGLLSELASVRLATPIEVTAEELASERWPGPLDKSVSNPAPWPGGSWSLADIVSLELSAAAGLLRYCSLNAERIVADYRRMCLDGRAAADGGPAAYLLPRRQHDPAALERLAGLLADHGIEVEELAAALTLGDEQFPEGTVLISGRQPFRPFIRSMFERIRFPHLPAFEGGSPRDPYDVSGWTLADQYGLRTRQVSAEEWEEAGLDGLRRPYAEVRSQPLGTSTGDTFYPAGDSSSYAQVNEILAGGGFVSRTTVLRETGEPEQLFVHYDPNRDASATDISGRIEEARASSLSLPRLGLLRGNLNSMDEGWTRLLLERFGFPHQELTEERVRAGDLLADFDAVILPNVRESTLIEGRDEEEYPPEFRGGVGEEGLEALERFVAEGGTLICLSNVCRTVIERFELPVVDLLHDVERRDFSIPGSLIRIETVFGHPLAFGMPERIPAMFVRSLAFDLPEGGEGGGGAEIAARYADSDLLVSGFARGEELIAGKAAVAVVGHGEGRVVLIGFPCQFRAQPYATFKLLFNSIYLAGDRAAALDAD